MFLAGTAAGVAALPLAATVPARAGTDGADRVFASPVLGTWRGQVDGSEQDEIALLTFLPGGFFQSFADGIHVAAGRWEPTGPATVRFSLWQVMPFDLDGLPHRYHGEVQAIHQGRVSGDTLSTAGTWRALDADGIEQARGTVSVTATRFGVRPF
jgi:hypothetical protein